MGGYPPFLLRVFGQDDKEKEQEEQKEEEEDMVAFLINRRMDQLFYKVGRKSNVSYNSCTSFDVALIRLEIDMVNKQCCFLT